MTSNNGERGENPNKLKGLLKVWNVLAAVLLLTALLNLGVEVYSVMTKPPITFQIGSGTVTAYPNTLFIVMKTRIAVALIVSVVGLLFGRLRGLVISALALGWIIVEYLAWWRGSFYAIQQSGSSFSKFEHIAYLIDANWWDIWVLIVVTVVLITAMILMSAFRNEYLPRPLRFK